MDAAAIQIGPQWSGDAGNIGAGAGVSQTGESGEGSPLLAEGTASPASFRSSWSDSLQALAAKSGDRAMAATLTALTVGKGGTESRSEPELAQSRGPAKGAMRNSQRAAMEGKTPASKASSTEGAASAQEREGTHAKQKKDRTEGAAGDLGGGSSSIFQSAVLLPVSDPAGQPIQVAAKRVPKPGAQEVQRTQFEEISSGAETTSNDAGPISLLRAPSQGSSAAATDNTAAKEPGVAVAPSKDPLGTVVTNQDAHGSGPPALAPASSAAAGTDLATTSLADAQVASPGAMAIPRAETSATDRDVRRIGLQQSGRTPDAMGERGAAKATHSSASGGGTTDGSGIASQTSGGSAVDASPSLFRDLGSPAGANGSPANSSHGLSIDGNTLPSKDALAALDADRGVPSTAWIHAGAHHAEAGYLDSALGWIGVRADSVGGGVHASVVPGSSEAAQVLGSHLSGLNAFLAEQHQQTATVTLAAPQGGLDGSGLNQGSGGGASYADSQETSHHGNESVPASATTSVAVSVSDPIATRAPTPLGGTHISVLA